MSSIVIIRTDVTDKAELEAISQLVGKTFLEGNTAGLFVVDSFDAFKRTIIQGMSQTFSAEDLATWSDEQLVAAFTDDNQQFAGGIIISIDGDNDVPAWVIEQARLDIQTLSNEQFTVLRNEFPPVQPPHVNREMRQITRHLVDGESTQLTVHVADEPGSGGAHHLYLLDGFDFRENPSMESLKDLRFDSNIQGIFFQNGPVKESTVNGITGELLVALVIDRLECFQAGPYACEENAIALDYFVKGLETLQLRTKRRIAQGVEGVSEAHASEPAISEIADGEIVAADGSFGTGSITLGTGIPAV